MTTSSDVTRLTPESQRTGPASTVILLAIWAGVLLPLALHLAGLPSLGRLQRDDYYGVIRRLTEGDQLTTDIERWLDVRIVQHRVVLPALLWTLNIKLTGGDNRFTAGLAILLLSVIFALLVKQLPRPPSARSLAGWGPALLLSVLLFAPGQAYNIALSFGGTHYYLADFFALLAMILLLRHRERASLPWILLPIAVLGILSFSSHLAVWPALVFGVVYAALPRRHLLPVVLGAGLAALVYLSGTRLIANHASSLPAPGEVLRYLGCFVGALFSREPEIARLIGWTGIVISLGVHGWIGCRESTSLRRLSAFWVMAQVYVLGCGLLAAVGRAEMGEDQALTLRYALFPSLFWSGLLIPLGFLVVGALPRRYHSTVRLAVLASILVGAQGLYERDLRIWLHHVSVGERQRVAEEALRLDIWDAELMKATVTRVPRTLHSVRPILRSLRHVPFDRPAPRFEKTAMELEKISPDPHPEVEGMFGTLHPTRHSGYVRARGWIHSREHRVREVFFLDPERRISSRLLLRTPRRDLGSDLGWISSWSAGWEGFVEIHPKADWTAYYRLEGDPTIYPLLRNPHIRLRRILSLAGESPRR